MAQNPNIDDATRARAMRYVSAGPAGKPRTVSKKELEASGLSLRDFLNRERGLTRRKEADPTLGEARDKAAQEAADRVDPGDDGGLSVVRRQDAEAARNAKNMSAYKPRRVAAPPEELSDMTYKRGGAVKKYAKGGSVSASSRGDGCATKGKTRGKML